MTAAEPRTPEEIEAEIARTRADMDQTLTALEDKLSPSQLMDQAIGYMRSAPADIAGAIGRAVRDNPVPVAMIGTGFLWLAVSALRPARPSTGRLHRANPYGGLDDGGYRVGSADEDVYDKEVGRYRPARTGQAPHTDTSPPGFLGQSTDPSSSGRRHRPSNDRQGDMMSNTGHVSGQAAGRAEGNRGRLAHLGETARETVHNFSDRAQHAVRDQAEWATARARRLWYEQPLVIGAIAFAVGATVGALLPPTRREDALLGETRDRLRRRAEDFGRDQLRKAREVADEALNAAQREADREDLTVDGARRTAEGLAEEVAHRARRVAEAAGNAALDKAESEGLPVRSLGETEPGRGQG